MLGEEELAREKKNSSIIEQSSTFLRTALGIAVVTDLSHTHTRVHTHTVTS